MSRTHRGYKGLKNLGSTCYLNSVLQILFMTKEFRAATERFTDQIQQQSQRNVSSALKYLFTDLKDKNASPEEIAKALCIENVCRQEDAAQYYQKILNLADASLSEIFQGAETIITTCQECETPKERNLNFFLISLALDSSSADLQKWFDIYFVPSLMNEENQMFCQNCKIKTDRKVEHRLLKKPTVLTIQLKKFEYSALSNRYLKKRRIVNIPFELQTEGYTYDLYAVVNHEGNLSNGHYTAEIKSFEDKQWYLFNDYHVNMSRPSSQYYGKSCFASEDAYLIFYRQQTVENVARNKMKTTEDKKRKNSGNLDSENQESTPDVNSNPTKHVCYPTRGKTASPASEQDQQTTNIANIKGQGEKQLHSPQSDYFSGTGIPTEHEQAVSTGITQQSADEPESHSSLCMQSQSTFPAVLLQKEKYGQSCEAKKLNRFIAECLSTGEVSVPTLEKSEFRQFIRNLLLTCDTKYDMPPLVYFLDTEIPELYSETRNVIQAQLTQSLFLSCSSQVSDSCMTVTVHCVTDSGEMQSWWLGSHNLGLTPTRESLKETFEKMVKDMWKVDLKKISCITIDNTTANHVAFGSDTWIPCFEHSLSSALIKAISTDCIVTCLIKLRNFVVAFTSSPGMTDLLSKKQSDMQLHQQKLLHDDPTCWKSTLEMIDCFFSQHQVLCSIQEEVCKENQSSLWSKMPTEREIKTLQVVTCVLKQFSDVKGFLLSAVKPLMQWLSNNATNAECCSLAKHMYTIISDYLMKSFEGKCTLLNTATFLDPRFKHSYESKRYNVKELLLQELQKSQEKGRSEENSQGDSVKQKATSLNELMLNLQIRQKKNDLKVMNPRKPEERLLDELQFYEKMEEISADEDPLAWWSAMARCLPALANFAKQYLCIATSCASAQRCSTALQYDCKKEIKAMLEFLSNNLTQAKKLNRKKPSVQ